MKQVEGKALDLMGGQYIDITPEVTAGIAVFPGDTPYQTQFLAHVERGDAYTLSRLTTTVHLGAHADSPIHYCKGGEGIGERSLHFYCGQVQVVDVSAVKVDRIRPQHITDVAIRAPRILFKTHSFLDPNHWRDDFMSLSGELVEELAQQKVILVGIDTPSIDLAQDQQLESHQAVAKNNMAILEGLVLTQVPAGLYTLVALPLKLMGADASPVRAILYKEKDATARGPA